MEDPKAFSAPITSLNDDSGEGKKEQASPYLTTKSSSNLKVGEEATRQNLERQKSDISFKSARSSPDLGEQQDGFLEDNPPVKNHDGSEQKVDADSNAKPDIASKDGDLEACLSGSSRTSETIQAKEEDDFPTEKNEPEDPNIVDWDGPDDPQNPMNWPTWKIKAHIFLVSTITFVR